MISPYHTFLVRRLAARVAQAFWALLPWACLTAFYVALFRALSTH